MATNHDRFVVGLFDEKREAEEVSRALNKADFEDINIRDRSDLGGMTDYLKRHGVPESHAHFYAEGVRRGGHIVTVFTDDHHYAGAVELMRGHGAVDISRRLHFYRQAGFKNYDQNAKPYTDQEISAERQRHASHQYDEREGEKVLPETEERIHIGKQKVQRGGVRIFAREREVPVERNVTLRDETIHVDRRNVDRAATEDDLRAFREGDIQITETDEEPVVRKETRVTGEVHVGKTAEERTQTVRDTAKKREVEVEKTNKPGDRR